MHLQFRLSCYMGNPEIEVREAPSEYLIHELVKLGKEFLGGRRYVFRKSQDIEGEWKILDARGRRRPKGQAPVIIERHIKNRIAPGEELLTVETWIFGSIGPLKRIEEAISRSGDGSGEDAHIRIEPSIEYKPENTELESVLGSLRESKSVKRPA